LTVVRGRRCRRRSGEVEAYVRNIEDHNVKSNAYVYMIQNVPYPLAVYQPPRTWGVRLRYRF
jgi:iron complex outermembrane receptor protein